jgi:hypothetical protein
MKQNATSTCTQDKNSTCQHYYETFKNNVEVVKYCGGVICKDTGLVDGELISAGLTCKTATSDSLSDAKDAAREHVLACAFLFGSDKNHYGKLLEDLKNVYTQRNDTYQTSLQQAYTVGAGNKTLRTWCAS